MILKSRFWNYEDTHLVLKLSNVWNLIWQTKQITYLDRSALFLSKIFKIVKKETLLDFGPGF